MKKLNQFYLNIVHKLKNIVKEKPNMSLTQYKISECFAIYDNSTPSNRILDYRLGWLLFKKDNQTFKQYSDFINKKSVISMIILESPLYILTLVIITYLMVYLYEFFHSLSIPIIIIGFGFIISLLFITYTLRGFTKKNRNQAKDFFHYINSEHKKSNFNFFNSMDIHDEESAEMLFEHFTIKHDFEINDTASINFDKSVKLLALDFLLGNPGSLKDNINQLYQNRSIDNLTKVGIYKVFGSILGRSFDNIKGFVEGDELSTIRTSPIESKRIQLTKVREIFVEANLRTLATKIDKVLEMIPQKKSKD